MKRWMRVQVASRLLSAVLGGLSLILLARAVPVGAFGTFSVALALFTTVYSLSSLGIAPFASREAAASNYQLVLGGLRLNVYTTLLALLTCGVLLFATTPSSTHWIAVGVALALGLGLEKNLEPRLGVLIAQRKIGLSASVVAGRATLSFGLFVAMLVTDISPLLAYAGSRALSSLLAVLVVTVSGPRFPGARERVQLVPLARALWPIATTSTISAIRSLDLVIIGAVGGSIMTGLYSAAQKLVSPAAIVATSMSTVLMPVSVHLDDKSASTLVRRIIRAAVLLTALSSIIAVFSPQIVTLILGADYAAAASALAALLVAVPSGAMTTLLATLLQARGSERFVTVTSAIFSPALLAAVGVAAISGSLALVAGLAAAVTIGRFASLAVYAVKRVR